MLVPLSTLLRPPELLAQLQTASVTHLVAATEFRGRRYLDDSRRRRPGCSRPARAGGRHPAVPSLRAVWPSTTSRRPRRRRTLVAALEDAVRPADDLGVLFTSGSRGAAEGRRSTPTAAPCGPRPPGLDARCVRRRRGALHPDAVLLDRRVRRRPAHRARRRGHAADRGRARAGAGPSPCWSGSGPRCSGAGRTRPPASPPHPDVRRRPTCRRCGDGSLPARAARPSGARRPAPGPNLFGMTETFGPYCGDRLDTDLPAGGAGQLRPARSPGWRCRSSTRRPARRLPAGEQGEIWLRGPNLLRGHLRPAARRGVHRRRLVPHRRPRPLDADGYLWYAGRLDDMFKVKGATVYPSEVEAALRAVPGVRAAHVTDVAVDDGGPRSAPWWSPTRPLDEVVARGAGAARAASRCRRAGCSAADAPSCRCWRAARSTSRRSRPCCAARVTVGRTAADRLADACGKRYCTYLESAATGGRPQGKEPPHGRHQPAHRRRQPLLRGARRLHPAPRPEVPRPRRAPGAGGQAGLAAHGRQGQHASSRTPRSTRSSCPAASTRCSGARSPRASTPARSCRSSRCASRVPGPRRADRGHGRAGPRRRAAVPHARLRRRAGAARRHPGHHGEPLRLQPVARGRLGLRLPGPARSRRRCCRWPIPTPRWPRSSSLLERGARIVHMRPAPVPGAQRHQPLARRQAARSRSGPAWPRPACPSRSTSATAATTPSSPRRGAPATEFGFGKSDPLGRVIGADRAIQDTVASLRRPRRVPRATRRCASPASRTAPTGSGVLVKHLTQAGQPDAVGLRRGSARHHPPPRLGHPVPRGGPRRRWPSSSASSASCSARTGPTARASPSRSTSPRSSARSTRPATQRIMRDNCLELLGAGA